MQTNRHQHLYWSSTPNSSVLILLVNYEEQNMHQQRSYPIGSAKRALKREREEEAKKSRKINEFFVKTTAEVPKNELSTSETTENRRQSLKFRCKI